MSVLYVTSDVPGAGKTAFCGALAQILASRGESVAILKPLAFGKRSRQDHDQDFFSRLVGHTISDAWPQVLSSPKNVNKELLENIQRTVGEMAAQVKRVIVEGPSITEGNEDLSGVSRSLAQALNAHTVAVLRYTPQMSVDTLPPFGELFGPSMLGVVLNQVTRYKKREVQVKLIPSLETRRGISPRTAVRVLGAIPEDRRMLAVTVGQLVEHIDGRFVSGEDGGDKLVENIMIGGLVLEWGINYFGRFENKAVMVRGDRPDIQMAALDTPTSCLILTGGIDPTQYVNYESKEEEVPLVVVDLDTHQSATRLETLYERASVHHPAKLEVFQDLLASNVNLDPLSIALSS